MDKHSRYMDEAVKEAYAGIHAGHGGPFGSVVVMDGEIVGRGHNRVLEENDPTCHGEISAIRAACKALGTHDLNGAVLYTTGEPCQMCLAACMWARLDKVYYGCTLEDNSLIGFRDVKIDALMGGRTFLHDFLVQVDRDKCLKLFSDYLATEHTLY